MKPTSQGLILQKKGIKPLIEVNRDSQIRCPYCRKLFAVGDIPETPIEVQCPRCKDEQGNPRKITFKKQS